MNSIYTRVVRPVFQQLNDLLASVDAFCRYPIVASFVAQEPFQGNATAFYDSLWPIGRSSGSSALPPIFEYGELHLDLLSKLGKVHLPLRDQVLLVLLRVSAECDRSSVLYQKMVDKLIELAIKHNAQQVFIKVAFEEGARTGSYELLHRQIGLWGRDFLVLSLRVVYILEKRKAEELDETNEDDYPGFKMIEIFADQYYDELEEFFRIVNPNLLAVLMAWHLKDTREAAERSRQCNIICNILLNKIQHSEEPTSKQSLASLGEQVCAAQGSTASTCRGTFHSHFLTSHIQQTLGQ